MLYLFDNYSLDVARRELRRGAQPVSLEPQVLDLLAYLIRNRDRVVGKDDLIGSIWGGRIVSDSALSTRINAVRAAVGDNGEEQRLIKTYLRKGVRFVGEVREQEDAAPANVPTDVGSDKMPQLALVGRPSIAVLPFTNMSGDEEQEYFADGMAEEIITALSRCKWLFVIARNSSFTYKHRTVDIRQVGRELGVRYVLEGSVRRGGTRVRFTGQLIDAISGAHIWADRFDGEMSDVFELQDRFTENVVAAIEPNLQSAEIERLKHKPAASLDAYDLLLRAQQLEYDLTEVSLAAAISCLDQALAIDPAYAHAMALAAYCYAERRSQGWAKDLEAEATEGLRLADRAVELGNDNGNVLWLAAFAVWRLATDAQRAKDLAYRSLLLNPNSAIALAIAGWMEMVSPDHQRALEFFHRSERLSPRDPRGWFTATGMAHIHFMEGRFDEATAWARKAVGRNSRSGTALRYLAASLAKFGQRDRAVDVVRALLKIEPQLTISRLRARLQFLDDGIWKKFADGLRLAGVPE